MTAKTLIDRLRHLPCGVPGRRAAATSCSRSRWRRFRSSASSARRSTTAAHIGQAAMQAAVTRPRDAVEERLGAHDVADQYGRHQLFNALFNRTDVDRIIAITPYHHIERQPDRSSHRYLAPQFTKVMGFADSQHRRFVDRQSGATPACGSRSCSTIPDRWHNRTNAALKNRRRKTC